MPIEDATAPRTQKSLMSSVLSFLFRIARFNLGGAMYSVNVILIFLRVG